MSVSIRASMTGVTGTGVGTISAANWGATIIPGDLLFVAALAYGGSSFAGVSGWTMYQQGGVALYTKVATGSGDANLVTALGSGTDNLMSCGVALYSPGADHRAYDSGVTNAQASGSGSGHGNTQVGVSTWPHAGDTEGVSVLAIGGHGNVSGADAPYSYFFSGNGGGMNTDAFARVDSTGGWSFPTSLYLRAAAGLSTASSMPAFNVFKGTNDESFNVLGAWTYDLVHNNYTFEAYVPPKGDFIQGPPEPRFKFKRMPYRITRATVKGLS